jgi:hypothetical protein
MDVVIAGDWLAVGTRVGKQVMKIPAPIRKGYAAGLMVPIPGSAEVGALAGTGVWAKNRIEGRVRRSTGEPYRLLFATPARRMLGDAYVRMEFAQLRETQEELRGQSLGLNIQNC